MAKIYYVLLGVLIVNISAAPSEVEKVDDIVKTEKADQKLDGKTVSLLDEAETDSKENQRQKRWYSNFGFTSSFQSNPSFSSFEKRVEPYNTGFDFDDSFVEIHRRLQDINNVVRQPTTQQFPSNSQYPSNQQFPSFSSSQFPSFNQFPFYLPVFYVPQGGCNCPNENEKTPPVESPTENTPPATTNTVTPTDPVDEKNMTLPETPNRFTEIEDERQNFGLVINENDADDEGEDVGRPISFDPIQPKRPMSRPPPPVDHGSNQGQAGTDANSTPAPPPLAAAASTTVNAFVNPSTQNPLEAPSACDGAVLSCCHQLQVTYDCFSSQGCPDPSSYGNPCDSNVILRVIDRFQRFYGQRNR